jgi:cellulose synthase (UDP-forming)
VSLTTRATRVADAALGSSCVRSDPVFRWWDYPIFAALTILAVAASALFLSYWLTADDWADDAVPFVMLTVLLLFNLAVQQVRWCCLPWMRRPRQLVAPPGYRVGVATTFVPGAESLPMLEHTVAALVAMDYPHGTWVLDEGDSQEVRQLCDRLGAHHFSRKQLAKYQTGHGKFAARTKHGNYNAWLDAVGFASYDVVVSFDPDHVPARAYLGRVLAYFAHSSIGYVQAPQAYYNQRASFIARGAAEETYAYYSSIQMANYTLGHPIITGCHTAHRVTALKSVGGFAPHEADDLLITLLYRAAGWRGVYVPEILARGLTPVDWKGYLAQQRRWARSVLDVKFRVYPRLAPSLPWRERVLGLMHGAYYLRSTANVLGLGALLVLLVTGRAPEVLSWAGIGHAVPLMGALVLLDLYRQRFFLDGGSEWGLHWRAGILSVAKWPYIVLALYDAARGYAGPYVLTRKVGARGRAAPLLLPHSLVAGGIAAAWITGELLGHAAPPVVKLVAAVVLLVSLAIIATDWLPVPEPYDPQLCPEAL